MKSWNILIGICLGALAMIAALDFFLPAPKSEMAPGVRRKQMTDIQLETKDAKDALSADTAYVSSQLWVETAGLIGPAVLSEVKSVAAGQGLTLKSFRPQRTTIEGRIERFPFLASVEGSFPDLINFIANLESPGTRIGVTLVQCSALDGDQTNVAASVAIVAIRDTEAKPSVAVKETTNGKTAGPTRREKKGA